jgi:hypothetical protein
MRDGAGGSGGCGGWGGGAGGHGDGHVDSSANRIKELELQVSAWEKAVNAWCSCGGKGPNDGCCVACLVYHSAKGTKA